MNSLSWMIYLAEVAGNLRSMAALGLFIGAPLAGFGLAVWAIEGKIGPAWRACLSIYIFFVAGLLVTAAFMPSSRTIYMIAASEAGETVVTSPEAKEILNDLRELIRRKLKDEVGA
jgi:MFS family permease